MALGSNARDEIKLGFWVGVGLLLLGLLMTVIQITLSKIRGS